MEKISFMPQCLYVSHRFLMLYLLVSESCPQHVLELRYIRFFLFFFSTQDVTTQCVTSKRHKKLVQISSSQSRVRFIVLSGLKIRLKCSYMHTRAIQCKHTPYSAVLNKSGKYRQRNMRVRDGYSPFFLRTRGCKTLQTYGFPV